MSIRRRLVNAWLKAVEKPRFRRAKTPEPLRKALEIQSRLFFHPPRGTSQSWIELGNVPALEVTPPQGAPKTRALLYFHGGAFTFGSPRTHSAMLAQLAHRVGARAILPQYRLAPEATFPAAADDALTAWHALIDQGCAPQEIIIGGDSAGGALAFGLLAHLCDTGAALPGAVFGFSPLTDLTFSSQSLRDNAECEAVLPAEKAGEMAQMFLAGHSPKDPRVSPIFGKFDGSSPVWITVGDAEILLDDARKLAQVCKANGVDVTLVERHDLPHVWPIFHNILPEARETLDELAQWIKQQPGWQDES